MVKLVNRAKMTTATTGTGTITLGAAVSGFQTFTGAGVVDGDVVRYVIEDGDAFEIGTGVFGSAGGTLTRNPSESSAGGGAITLTGNALVFVGAASADVQSDVNITGGTINGTVIGGTTPAAISGTTGSFSGNVGIGTSSPATKLHVETGAAATAITLSAISATSSQLQLGIGAFNAGLPSVNGTGNGLDLGTSGAGTVRFHTNGSERLRIDSGGNLLFTANTTVLSPDTVAGSDNKRVILSSTDTGGSSRGALIQVIGNQSPVGGFQGRVVLTAGQDASFAGTQGSIMFQTSGNDRMVLTRGGDLGIGTNSPTTKLAIDTGSASATALTMQAAAATSAKLSLGLGMFSAGFPTVLGTANGLDLGTSASAPVRFFTNNAERLRIDASGKLLVGTSSTLGPGSLAPLQVSGSGTHILDLRRQGSTGNIVVFRQEDNATGSISVTATTTSYNTTSDYRLKEDVQPMVGASDRVLSLKPCNFAWKADGSRVDGFIAHEAQAVVPEAVTGDKDGDEMQVMDHSKLVPLLTAALQDALKEIADLKGRITALEA